MKHKIDMELLLKHIRKSDLLGMEKLYLEELILRGRWIPCDLRKPEDGDEVVVYAGGGYVTSADYNSKIDCWCIFDSWESSSNITHWMPLPEPPEMEDEND